MNEIFFISEGKNNNITPNDIEVGQLRVGVINQKYFPNDNCGINKKIFLQINRRTN